ncbi:MAG TPA: UbiH/UbiF/VisC/COQ6 family ubiquinone biosynthesis hydroxylase [Stellaceae bacterium]|jgi:2-octaprenyl-6-methoxyphenol hydroxylase|nr:UbiH/UbiF/VisC/COQ6 family ubiquinone biosynthesis hydroxylase [Stellaceae bacterium]
MSDDAELLIAGGGLNGLLLGIACAGAGLAVALVDREDPERMLDQGFDGRSSAIAYGSQQVLAALGLWPLLAGEAEPIREIRVADDDAKLFLHYDHRELAPDQAQAGAPLGWIIENRVLRRVLIEQARALPTLAFLAPLAVDRVLTSAAAAEAALCDGRRLTARLVAAADGAASPLRHAASIRTLEWRYPQTAIVTTARHARPHAGVAVEHFLPAGPFAILPMTGNRSSIVWTEHEELAPRLLALADAEFAVELAARFGDFLGAVEPVGPRWSYPVGLMLAERYVDRRLALIGEAAHVIHPIAGQGLNLGIRDVAALAEIVIDQRRLGLDIGDDAPLRRYQQWRRLDTMMLAAVTDGLNRLFSNSIPPLRLARDVGLAAVNRLPPLKRFLMRDAMGITGTLPRLVRGEKL